MPIEKRRRVLVDGHWVYKTYVIYTREEADFHRIEYIPWRQAREEGQWVIDDAGWVSQVIRTKLYHVGKTKKYPKWRVTLPYGPFFATRQRLDYAEWSDYKRDYDEDEANKARSKRTAKAYAKVFIEREGKLTDDDLRILGTLYRSDQKVPEATLRRWLKISKVQDMIANELSTLLVSKGVEKGDIIDKYNTLYETAVGEGQLSVAKGILDKLAEMHDMKPDKVMLQGGMDVTQQLSGVSLPEIPEWAGDREPPTLVIPEEADGDDIEPDR